MEKRLKWTVTSTGLLGIYLKKLHKDGGLLILCFMLKGVTEPASTLMACPPSQNQQEKFVQVRSDEGLLPYNSKLPVVVYVPNDFDVHYRIWTVKEESGVAEME